MKTAELTGAALDWAVAKCEHGNLFMEPYSTSWAQGGPIIEQNLLVISPDPEHNWVARGYMDAVMYAGQTPLIAAMRCYVASKLGDDVDVPEELK